MVLCMCYLGNLGRWYLLLLLFFLYWSKFISAKMLFGVLEGISLVKYFINARMDGWFRFYNPFNIIDHTEAGK